MKILFLSTAFLMTGASLSATACWNPESVPAGQQPDGNFQEGEKIPSVYGDRETILGQFGISSDSLPSPSALPPYTQGYRGDGYPEESVDVRPPYTVHETSTPEEIVVPAAPYSSMEHMIAAGQQREDFAQETDGRLAGHLLEMGSQLPSTLPAGHVRNDGFPEQARLSIGSSSFSLEPVSDHVPRVLDYASVLTQNQFKEPHISVDALPYPMTINNLEVIFAPCIAQGDYAPLVNFFYGQLDLLDLEKQLPAVQWLERNNSDPICAYLYLRWHYYKVDVRKLSPEAIRELWFKRYLAELLLEFDGRAMNIDHAAIDAHNHIRDNIKQFAHRLDGWMSYIPKSADALHHAATQLENMFVKCYAFPRLHGNPFWLYTAFIYSAYLGFSNNFVYVKPDAAQEPLNSLMYAPLKEDFLIHELKTKAQFFIKDLREQATRLA